MSLTVTRADTADAAELAAVAAATFPLACPPAVTESDIAGFVAAVLSEERFTEYLRAPERTVLKAVDADGMVGYSMLVAGPPEDAAVRAAVTLLPTVEISKLYVLPDRHGGDVAHRLMETALDHARTAGATGVWLGVSQENLRARRFYAKSGFQQVGTKRFRVGSELCHDFVLERPL
ncbi:GNAT family N-acetyltransferase [Rhodococcus kronopolitis]|uniref:GNAT family N-acetyltransferase n=1 Tax=Rhodococcus kronopolitis TaxID=1460226 RepID=A0ABV9FP38_9NOCA